MIAIIVLAGTATGSVLVRQNSRAGSVRPAAVPSTTTVVRDTLVDVVTARGELAYGPELLMESRLSGTVTRLAGVGATVKRGEALFWVDDKPVVLLYGKLPAYRELTVGRSGSQQNGGDGGTPPTGTGATPPAVPATRGADVRQFEQNLQALGYTGFVVDDQFTAQTAGAVRRWQKDLGVEPTGVVELGRVLYSPASVRVAAHKLVAGQVASGPVLSFTGTERLVTAKLPAHHQALAKPKAKVTVALGNGAQAPGVVRSVRTPAEDQDRGGGQGPVVEVVVALADPKAFGGSDEGPATVRFVAEQRKGVLVVPVGALLALTEGGHGLEVIEGGASRIIPVETGLYADGRVEVSGPEVQEGMTVGMAQ
ncbi:peptidoglycan-binding protein [Micromonospora sp. RP3T]|uniref:peptidoglycan-binding protein n=1 Tax=Micromonospora sp. RP3T TaxID=2135446 RepID=UPI0018EC54AD|nr:peptidoglycan-binding protein [Micromonospora sp. RP3T]